MFDVSRENARSSEKLLLRMAMSAEGGQAEPLILY
jgi:hypothetical protein